MQKLENQHEITITILKENKQKENEVQNNTIIKSDISIKKELEKNNNETTPLIKKKKLFKILNDINKTLNDEKNKNKNIDDILKKFNKKEKTKEIIKTENSNAFNIFMFFIAGIFVIINLTGIFTLKSVMDSLLTVFKNDIKYFLWEKSDLESKELTDFESRFNSSYNFYKQFFNDISKNKVDFDLIMFWDFIGLLLYEYFNFTCTSIFLFIVNIILLIIIGNYDYLDIDEKTHQYSFFKILYISLIYIFIWIGVGSSALLSQQIFIETLDIYVYKKNEEKNESSLKEGKNHFELKKEDKKEEQKRGAINDSKNNSFSNLENHNKNNNLELHSFQKSSSNLNSEENENKEKIDNFSINKKEKKEKKENKLFKGGYLFIIYITIFFAYFINYIINKEILKFRQKYVVRELRKINKKDKYKNIYLKDKRLFLIGICIPYASETVLSLIIYSIFYNSIFIDPKEKKRNNEFITGKNNKENIDDNDYFEIEDASFKKICGYIIFNQTRLEKKEKPRCEDAFCFFKNIANFFCYCFECSTLILISLRKCMRNSFCLICDSDEECKCNCCDCDCCSETSCCCCDANNFGNKEISFCFCYQEKRKLEWFDSFINSKVQKQMVPIIFMIGIFQTFNVGLEEIYIEKNESNTKQENITLHLILSFLSYSLGTIIFAFLDLKILEPLINKSETIIFNGKIIFELTLITSLGSGWFILTINGLSSFALSIKYLKNKKSVYSNKYLYYPVFWSKYNILFIISLLNNCNLTDDENELISNSSLFSVYLYILELLFSLIKKILPLKGLIILQIVFTSFFLCFLYSV